MGTARDPQPVKLIASLLTGEPGLLAPLQAALEAAWGPIDLRSELLPFDHTDYYAAEFGPGLQRQIVAFERLISPAELPAAKCLANEVEQSLAAGGRRRVNVDPGYVSLGKLVLATTKDHAHRLYQAANEPKEIWINDSGHAWSAWTYPDRYQQKVLDFLARALAD